MTREEAAIIIKECKEKGFKHTFYTLNEYHTALDMAIKALEQEPCEDAISRQAVLDKMKERDEELSSICPRDIRELPPVTPQQSCEDIAKAFQLGLAFGFGEKHDEMDKVMEEVKKAITPQQRMGCEGCIYEKTGNNSTYPCSHCDRCYTDKYKAESEDNE